ncbi:Molecular chaperone DnaK [Planctomycetales bacterium 10988]|nr:Molecular chaperone DnaK [Planctomycetales bacterium 10988]
MQERAVGIDLGTTYSAMAWVDDTGQSVLIPNAEGDLLTPTTILFRDEEVLVGREAKKQGVYEPDRLAECVKRDMGKPKFHKSVGGLELPPEVIQAYVLKKLANDLASVVKDDFSVVITVPAFFDEPRRKATIDAAQIAGLKVIDIVNEPTAAALAFGEVLGYLKQSKESPEDTINVLVYDLGGGTFDATLIEMKAGNLRTIATDGDVQLGGRDWDEILVDHAGFRLQEMIGSNPVNDPILHQRLINHVEEVKHTLSVRKSASLKLTVEDQTHEIRITRDQFEEESEHLLERTAYVTRQLLTTSGLQWSDLNRIILVGGSTRMPMVSRMLLERTGIQPDHTINPDEAVARGAAVFADHLLASQDSEKRNRFHVTNVNSHSLGIEGVDPRTGRKGNNILIKKNTPLPAQKTKRFETKRKGQHSVVLKVLEGESSSPEECTPIGKTVIRNLPEDLPAGWPIWVTYEYGTNGRLSVTARLEETENEVRLELEREGTLSSALISKWRKLVDHGAGLTLCASFLKNKEVPKRSKTKTLSRAKAKASAPPVSEKAPEPSTDTVPAAQESQEFVETVKPSSPAPPTRPTPVEPNPVTAPPSEEVPQFDPQPESAIPPSPTAAQQPNHLQPSDLGPSFPLSNYLGLILLGVVILLAMLAGILVGILYF